MNKDVETFLASRSPAMAEVARHLSEVILSLLPQATISMDEQNLGFGVGTGYKGLIFTIAPHTSHVTLGVAGGARLPDPDGLLEGSGTGQTGGGQAGLGRVERTSVMHSRSVRLRVTGCRGL